MSIYQARKMSGYMYVYFGFWSCSDSGILCIFVFILKFQKVQKQLPNCVKRAETRLFVLIGFNGILVLCQRL